MTGVALDGEALPLGLRQVTAQVGKIDWSHDALRGLLDTDDSIILEISKQMT
jgi:hypothetical protein